jgi:putative membrane protein
MSADEPQVPKEFHHFEPHASAETHFSWLRTRLSVERTLMSWVRTATALIGFGFTIVQFFERLNAMESVAPAKWPELPRYVGLALIGAGVLGLVISCWQYVWVTNYLWSEQFKPIAGLREGGLRTPLLLIAIILIFIGIFALGAILLRAL